MGFTFVDRISTIAADHARGEVWCTEGEPLPPWLLIEAVGQLAAWIAMRRCEFRRRPVAALVPEVRLSGAAMAAVIDLEARIERLDRRAVLYSGTARSGGTDLAVLSRCVGPLLPMETFDDPTAVQQRFESLCRADAADRRGAAQHGAVRPVLSAFELDETQARAQLRVPQAAPFFREHFPRFPVYPAALLADAQNQVAISLAARLLGVEVDAIRPSGVNDFKVRAFSPPGQVLELIATPHAIDAGTARIAVAAIADDKRVATAILHYSVISSSWA
jgi:3-hydroxymyristoyl/3-hydroxydecanoyl-(acyl carrier protein) dehydratase